MPFLLDFRYLMIMIPCMALSGLCAWWVKSAFNKYSRVGARNGMTGAQIARAILQWNGIGDVRVEETQGFLSDHYDPRSKTLRLSSVNYRGQSVASLGVAAHEVGHAIQHANAYAFLTFRSKMVPVVGIGSQFGIPMIIFGAIFHLQPLALVGVIFFGATTLFSIVTLPVEFDASNRALKTLEEGRILDQSEMVGARRVLRAAASTYVASAITSIVILLYWLWRLGLIGGRSR